MLKFFHNRIDTNTRRAVVCPELFPDDFDEYLGVLGIVENDILRSNEAMDGFVQIAPFHPLFRFEGSEENDQGNWTNRSPYPIFHILREEEVATAVEKLDGDAERVWKRNVELLGALGKEFGDKFETLFQGKEDIVESGKVKEVLQEFRINYRK